MKAKLLATFSILSLLSTPGCVPLIIPHKALMNATVRGELVDEDTGAPVAGVVMDLGGASFTRVSDANGRFVFEPQEKWRPFWIIPLLPFAEPGCREQLRIYGYGPFPVRYRALTIEVNSCPVMDVLGDRGELNQGLVDDLGRVRLKRLPEGM